MHSALLTGHSRLGNTLFVTVLLFVLTLTPATANMYFDDDSDGDGIPDATDNCPFIANSNQFDCDGDGEGNACEMDCDNNGIPDECEIEAQIAKLLASDAQGGDNFGNAVAIDGNYAIVGAFRERNGSANYDQGAAYIFLRSGNNWAEQAKLIAADGAAFDGFGNSVAINGDTVIVGAANDDGTAGTNQGTAYIFVRSGNVWSQQAQLIATDAAANDLFGSSVAIYGDTAVVGACLDDQSPGTNQGAVYIFSRTGSVWMQQAKLVAPDAANLDQFGFSVAIYQDTIVIGASFDSFPGISQQGSAYIFVRTGSVWTQQAKLTASDPSVNDRFGNSLAIHKNTVIVGTWQDDGSAGVDQGSAYVFIRTLNTWTQQAKLIAADAQSNDQFGFSVSLQNDIAVVGAHLDSAPNNYDQGSAYVFIRNGTAWTQKSILRSSYSSSNEELGYAVGISGNAVIAGAYREGTPVGGLYQRGAAYLFSFRDCDHSGIIDACEPGIDNDNIPDECDNCPLVYNPDQADCRQDGVGDACDPDCNANGVPDDCDLIHSHDNAILNLSIPANSMSAGHAFMDNKWSTVTPLGTAFNNTLGIGYLINPTVNVNNLQDLTLSDNVYISPYVPDPNRAVVIYEFNNPCHIDSVKIAQHTNGITRIEVFYGDSLDNMTSVAVVNGPLGTITGENVFTEGDVQTFTFDPLGSGRFFKFIIRRTSHISTYGAYRATVYDWSAEEQLVGTVWYTSDCDNNSVPDECQPNEDSDNFPDICDNCPAIINNDQADCDSDGIGDACETDCNNNGVSDKCDLLSPVVNLVAPDARSSDSFGFSVATDGETAIVGSYRSDLTPNANQGAAYVYSRTGNTWSFRTKLTAADAMSGDLFGASAAIQGNTAIIGANLANGPTNADQGSVYVFTRTAGVWSQETKLTAADAAAGDQFGISTAMDGNTIIVGAAYDSAPLTGQGSAYIFVRSGGGWIQQAKLTASDALQNDRFGNSVAIDGDTVIIGAFGDDGAAGFSQGSAYIFVRSGSLWTQQAKLIAPDAATEDQFGISVAISADTAIIGSNLAAGPGGSNQGAAYIFIRENGSWSLQAKLTGNEPIYLDEHLGSSVGIDGDTALVGVPGDDYSGSALLYVRTNGVWRYQYKLTGSDATSSDSLGFSVAISGNTRIVGDYLYDGPAGSNQGSAYIFQVPDCNRNGVLDVCDLDADGDGIPDACDNCPITANTNQADCDNNGVGDRCDTPDCNGNGIADVCDIRNSMTPALLNVSIPSGSMIAACRPFTDNVWSVATLPGGSFDQNLGIGFLVNPSYQLIAADFCLHGGDYIANYTPNPDKAIVTYVFNQPVIIDQIEFIQSPNGITAIEGFVGNSLDALTSIGILFGPAGDNTGNNIFVNGTTHVFDFNNTTPGTIFRFVIRKTSHPSTYASYRAFPRTANGSRLAGTIQYSPDCDNNGVPDECHRGNFDGAGGVDMLDVPPFVDAILNQNIPCALLADMDRNGIVNGEDIQPFIDCVVGTGPCP